MRILSSDRWRVVGLVWPLLTLALLAWCIGCSSASRDYPGVSPDALWQATVGAARNPKYSDWFVAENGVFLDEAEGRVEVYRELKRDYGPPGGALRRENQTWTFSIRVEADDRIPRVLLDTRTKIRTQDFWKQADHFFSEIDARLSQLPSDELTVPGVHPAVGVADPNGLQAPAALESSDHFDPSKPVPIAPNRSDPQAPMNTP